MHSIFIPIKKPQTLNKLQERISLKCFQTTIEQSTSCLYFLHDGVDGQLKLIKNNCKKKDITINTSGNVDQDNSQVFEIEKKTSIILIYIAKKKGWSKIYET